MPKQVRHDFGSYLRACFNNHAAISLAALSFSYSAGKRPLVYSLYSHGSPTAIMVPLPYFAVAMMVAPAGFFKAGFAGPDVAIEHTSFMNTFLAVGNIGLPSVIKAPSAK